MAVAIGAASRPPGSASRSSSPSAISTPNAIAARWPTGLTSAGCAVAVLATAATVSITAAASSSSRPESIACQDGHRSGLWCDDVMAAPPAPALTRCR